MMTRILPIAAALLLGTLSHVSAKTYHYTFEGYCDGVTISSEDDLVWTGTHTGSCEASQEADGFRAVISGPGNVIDLSTEEYYFPGYPEIFLLDTKAMTFVAYLDQGGGFAEIASGNLSHGKPPAGSARPSVASGASRTH